MFWILAGIVIALVQGALISNYLYLVENIILYDRISIVDFKKGFRVYLWKIYGVLVVLWFANYAASIFLSPILNIQIGFITLWTIVMFIAFIGLNCLPEVIYQKHYNVGESFGYCFDFIRENWLDWFIPNIILWIILYVIVGAFIPLNLFMGGSIFFSLTLKSLVTYIIGQFLFSFMMIYRGLLFQILKDTTRRKRMFMRNVYK